MLAAAVMMSPALRSEAEANAGTRNVVEHDGIKMLALKLARAHFRRGFRFRRQSR